MNPSPVFVDYATIRHDPSWQMPSHAHRHHEVIAVESGAMRVEIGGRRVAAGPGEVLFYRAGVPHREWADPARPATTLCLSCGGGADSARIAPCTRDAEGRVREMLRWIERDVAHGLRGDPGRCAALIGAIQAELVRLATPDEPELVARTVQYAQERLSGPITLTALAAHAHLSKFHYLRSYRRLTGRTPVGDVRRMRLERARSLVISTPWPLRRIALEVGLSSEFHLSRLFRRHFGVPPAALRSDRHGP